jgi:5-formyltetrahydrofolate cyclo-ligase
MNNLSTAQKEFWLKYSKNILSIPDNPNIEVGVAGNIQIADKLLALYLNGKKTAGSGLVKDYELAGDELPKIGNYWIILDSKNIPRCIVKTIRVEYYQFDKVPLEVAVAEGEGDLSLEFWYEAHVNFFKPFLSGWKIDDINKETLVTEFYEVVYKA